MQSRYRSTTNFENNKTWMKPRNWGGTEVVTSSLWSGNRSEVSVVNLQLLLFIMTSQEPFRQSQIHLFWFKARVQLFSSACLSVSCLLTKLRMLREQTDFVWLPHRFERWRCRRLRRLGDNIIIVLIRPSHFRRISSTYLLKVCHMLQCWIKK